IATKLLPGISYNGFTELAIFALLLGFLNAFVAPVIKLVTFPISIITLGLFSLVINAVMFWLAAAIVLGGVGFVTAFIAALIVSVVNMVLGAIL
ncbi:MAG TPA: phage holin family protein, partial [Chloroflexota bacterium]|nr:phage holin family protein [Chloroflexota bacterium]